LKEVTKVEKHPGTGMTVYDEETEKFVDVSPETQRLAAYVHQQGLMGAFISAVAIKKMFDEKLYLGMGCQSREEYVAVCTPYGRRQAYRYYKIATKFDSVTKLLTGEDLKPINLENGLVTLKSLNGENGSEIASLGLSKLYELSNLEDDEVADLIKKGKVDLPGGELTLQDIIDSTAREAAKKIAGLKKTYQSKISQLTEELKLKESEEKERRKLVEDLTIQNKEAKRIEAKFGDRATLLKHKYEQLEEANRLVDEASMVIRKCGVNEDDPAELQADLIRLLKKIDEVHEEFVMEFAEIVEAA
jgi:hypothetical protein